MSNDFIDANRISCVIASQIKAFAETLPEDKQAAIVLGENVIAISEVISPKMRREAPEFIRGDERRKILSYN